MCRVSYHLKKIQEQYITDMGWFHQDCILPGFELSVSKGDVVDPHKIKRGSL